ncbi:hypothetical protein PPERSA_01797 [Pseudocohnilembus persalinus]|uniref:Uncharacterized protein n=1 Tax=Pseudocohnilembus persalinus TaxID=266149 RepID=A0A0V0R239_PSEPJ|nr:hypothetical protein PPERSA_01797 [Pseudocohnilembus persalinus]|eukprot:KRX08336.1 hypothetical protein PPERSA_01797 [Pseudocohnilembus persalinus]
MNDKEILEMQNYFKSEEANIINFLKLQQERKEQIQKDQRYNELWHIQKISDLKYNQEEKYILDGNSVKQKKVEILKEQLLNLSKYYKYNQTLDFQQNQKNSNKCDTDRKKSEKIAKMSLNNSFTYESEQVEEQQEVDEQKSEIQSKTKILFQEENEILHNQIKNWIFFQLLSGIKSQLSDKKQFTQIRDQISENINSLAFKLKNQSLIYQEIISQDQDKDIDKKFHKLFFDDDWFKQSLEQNKCKKEDQIIIKHFEKLNLNNKLRRKSCFCTYCGPLSQIKGHYSQQDQKRKSKKFSMINEQNKRDKPRENTKKKTNLQLSNLKNERTIIRNFSRKITSSYISNDRLSSSKASTQCLKKILKRNIELGNQTATHSTNLTPKIGIQMPLSSQ